MVLEGVAYNIYYEPLDDSSGKCIGMVFAGRKYADIHADINHAILVMSIIAAVLVIITVLYAFLQNRSLEPIMRELVKSLESMSRGSLNIDIHKDALARKDELGRIAECIQKLDGELSGVIKKTLKLADNVSTDGVNLSSSSDSASGASNQVTDAMEDISKGAISQAENIETAANDTSDIGDAIEGINEKVAELDRYSEIMKTSCDNAMQALQHLLDQNARVIDSMKIIEHQILSTNEAVKNISNASNLITSISSQTNLLALNASIEAARAGEAGRGFAVVATEIGTLAEQSQAATVEIKTIVSDLIAESEKSVQTVNELSESFRLQNEQLDSTVSDMHEMQSGVENVTASANDISSRSNNLNEAKNNLVDIISDLSAISQENAAATEETNASMEELNATFEVINQSAVNLQDLARELHEEIRFFTIHGSGESEGE